MLRASLRNSAASSPPWLNHWQPRGSNAAMRKAQVPIVSPGNVEFIGAREPHRIAVGCTDHRRQEVARFDAVAPDVYGYLCATPRGLNRTVVSQELFHRALDQY